MKPVLSFGRIMLGLAYVVYWVFAFCTYCCRCGYGTSGRRTSGGMGDFDRNLLVGGSTEFFYQIF